MWFSSYFLFTKRNSYDFYVDSNSSTRRVKKLKRANKKKQRRTKEDLKKLKARSKKITTIKRICGCFLVLFVFAGCNYSVLVIAANSTTTEVTSWVKSYLISFVQDMLTTEFIKILLNVILIRALTRHPSRCTYKLMKLIVNPLIVRAVAMSNCTRGTHQEFE